MKKYLRILALTGNAVYILWIIYNGIDEGFKAKPVQAVVITGLMVLLALNFLLLYKKRE